MRPSTQFRLISQLSIFALASVTKGNDISFPLVGGPSIDPGLPGIPEASFAPGAGPASTTLRPHPVVQPSSLSLPPTTTTGFSSAFTSSFRESFSAFIPPSPLPIIPSNNIPANPDFFGLGDSFAAGIGASCGTIKLDDPSNGQCKKCMGGYP
jgi:hypothetical protein